MLNVVYHGSSKANIKKLKAYVCNHHKECIYATDRKVVALLFIGNENGDLDIRLSNVDGLPELVERRPGSLKKMYDKGGYLYELDGTTFNHYDYLWSLEVISFEKEIEPIKRIFYSNILKEIYAEEKKGNIIIYRYPNRPNDMPIDNSDLIGKYIRFEEQGIPHAIESLLQVYPEFSDRVEELQQQNEVR